MKKKVGFLAFDIEAMNSKGRRFGIFHESPVEVKSFTLERFEKDVDQIRRFLMELPDGD